MEILYFEAADLKSLNSIYFNISLYFSSNISFLSNSNNISDKLYSYFFLFKILEFIFFLSSSSSILINLLNFLNTNSFHNPSYFIFCKILSYSISYFFNKSKNSSSLSTFLNENKFCLIPWENSFSSKFLNIFSNSFFL